mmetsp:Transcript_17478/g.46582  ORF Transcript_17478/g.46582 Transcript_17478/m.46582 type:complete len:210 (-) Transcript_17478:372-1001(-)
MFGQHSKLSCSCSKLRGRPFTRQRTAAVLAFSMPAKVSDNCVRCSSAPSTAGSEIVPGLQRSKSSTMPQRKASGQAAFAKRLLNLRLAFSSWPFPRLSPQRNLRIFSLSPSLETSPFCNSTRMAAINNSNGKCRSRFRWADRDSYGNRDPVSNSAWCLAFCFVGTVTMSSKALFLVRLTKSSKSHQILVNTVAFWSITSKMPVAKFMAL